VALVPVRRGAAPAQETAHGPSPTRIITAQCVRPQTDTPQAYTHAASTASGLCRNSWPRPRPCDRSAKPFLERVEAHQQAAQFNGMVSGRPAPASVTAIAHAGWPDASQQSKNWSSILSVA